MALSTMGLNLGSSGFSPLHTQKQTQTNVFTIFARRSAFYVCFVFKLRPQYMQLTHVPDETQLFWLRENPEDSKFEPHAGIKMA